MKLANPTTNSNNLAPKSTVTVHGNTVQAEYPLDIDEVSRKGWGTTFWGKENTVNWFHIPLSVPNQMDSNRSKLTKVFFYFHNTSRSPITAVHIYDGPKVIKAFDGLRLSGDHARALDRSNSFTIDPPLEVVFGLGLSVKVDFPAAPEQAPPRWILFTAAGAEFRI
jgi:hypothetical protein